MKNDNLALQMFAERLKEKRIEKGLTHVELGRLVGVNGSTISRYETGKREPDLQPALNIAEYFGVSVEWMCGDEESLEVQDLIQKYESLSNDGKKDLQRYLSLLMYSEKQEATYGET